MTIPCGPEVARRLMSERPDCQVIDVREPVEFALGHVPGARLLPLGALKAAPGAVDPSRPIILFCKGGKRAAEAAECLLQAGFSDVHVVQGGTEAWAGLGLPIERAARAPWALDRQVRLVAGCLVLVGLVVPPWPWLSAIVGAGLVFAALTDSCGLAFLISRLPWNRAASTCSR